MGREGTGLEVDTHGQVENSPAGAFPNLSHGPKEVDIDPHLLKHSPALLHPDTRGNVNLLSQGK